MLSLSTLVFPLIVVLGVAGLVVGWRRSVRSDPEGPAASEGDVIHLLIGPDAPSAGGTRASGVWEWRVYVMAQAWRRPGEPVRRQPVRFVWPQPDQNAARAAGADHAAWSVVQVCVNPSTLLEPDASTARIEIRGTVLGPVDDEALQDLGRQLQVPQVVDDPRFGRLVLDRGLECFDGEAAWLGQTVTLTLAADGDSLSNARETALALWSEPETWHRRLEACIAEVLLPLKNRSWRKEDEEGALEPPWTAADLLARVVLQQVDVAHDGRFCVTLHDGGAFFGHDLAVSGSLEAGFTTADLVG